MNKELVRLNTVCVADPLRMQLPAAGLQIVEADPSIDEISPSLDDVREGVDRQKMLVTSVRSCLKLKARPWHLGCIRF